MIRRTDTGTRNARTQKYICTHTAWKHTQTNSQKPVYKHEKHVYKHKTDTKRLQIYVHRHEHIRSSPYTHTSVNIDTCTSHRKLTTEKDTRTLTNKETRNVTDKWKLTTNQNYTPNDATKLARQHFKTCVYTKTHSALRKLRDHKHKLYSFKFLKVTILTHAPTKINTYPHTLVHIHTTPAHLITH